jgi:glutamate N-acetyltransferase/amino-acid N-acetyltransferase
MTAPCNKIEGGVTAPKGFKASGFAAHIKLASTKLDCALIASDVPASVAGAFTKNLFKSPPCHWDEAVCARGGARAIFANSGNANACTGDRGAADVRATAEQVAAGLDIPAQEVCVLSTGVIGVTLPMDRIAQGVQGCLESLSPAGSHDAALAIMTTDTVPKEMAVALQLSGGAIRIGAIAKGSGMIAPNMATMFCLITTDAEIEAAILSPMLKAAVAVSFNQMCVDNDMSTSDTVLCLANGASGVEVNAGADADAFAATLTHVCQEMAKALVRDGEGATKFVEIQVAGAASDDDAKTIARAIAVSQLCKTAFYGQDPNWGRLACAAGYAGVAFDPDMLCIWIDRVKVMHNGMPADFHEDEAAACMRKPEFVIRLETGEGPGKATFWTSDLSHKYVEINADYRT